MAEQRFLPRRIFAPQLPSQGQFSIDGPEVRHAVSVLRLGVGDSLMAFDGKGGEAQCQIVQANKRTLELLIEERTDSDRELGFTLRAFVSLPKGDRQRVLVDGLVQLGVSEICPLVAKRSVVKPSSSDRLERYAIETSKQCGRNVLMAIGAPQTVDQLANETASFTQSTRLVAHPYGGSQHAIDLLTNVDPSPSGSAVRQLDFAIGPEGGFTEEEISQLTDSNWQAISLGKRILRTEVAALHVAGMLAATFERP